MTDIAIQVDHVYKKFRRGELHDTLRDLIPALAGRLIGRRPDVGQLGQQEFWALEDLCFEIPRGQAIGIIGHNGAGKSTLLKHLTGILRPTKGRMDINGRVSALIEVGAGFHVDLTGRENIFLNGSILGMSIAEVRRKFDEIVAFSGLEAFLDTPVKRYSSGMFAKLGFSVAAHLDPEILLIDEVLSVGDFAFQQKGVNKMKAIAAGGATVVFVSHNLRSVVDLCQRCLMLSRGRLVADGPTADVVHDYISAATTQLGDDRAHEIAFDHVTIRGEDGPRTVFKPGERVYIDIAGRAVAPTDQLDLGIKLLDPGFYELLNLSTCRPGASPLRLQPGERFSTTISLQLHLAGGSYQLAITAWRMDRMRVVDAVMNAGVVHMDAPMENRGVINSYPRLEAIEIGGSGADSLPSPKLHAATN